MATILEIKTEVIILSEKIDELSTKIDSLINNGSIALNELEAASAKIIADITDKINSCPCNKEILENLKNLPNTSTKPGKYARLSRYSNPNTILGNKNLGGNTEGMIGLIIPDK